MEDEHNPHNQKWVKIKLDLEQGGKAEIKITDGIAIIKFNKIGLARKNYEGERRLGNGRAEYSEKHDLYFEKYPGWDLSKVTKHILEELKNNGVNAKIQK